MTAQMTARQAKWVKNSDSLRLSGEVDFDNVTSLLRDGETWLTHSAPTDCSLDLASVTYSNSAGVALIMELCRIAQKHDKRLKVVGTSENLLSMMRLGGLDWLLGS